MPGISISGLGSNLDVESIIAKLMQVEGAPRARLELRQGQAKAREDALREIGSKLQAVADAAATLRSTGLWADVQSVQSSAPDSVSVRQLSGAGPGGYQVEVSQLARAEQRTYDFTPGAEASQLTINGTTVELGAGATPRRRRRGDQLEGRNRRLRGRLRRPAWSSPGARPAPPARSSPAAPRWPKTRPSSSSGATPSSASTASPAARPPIS